MPLNFFVGKAVKQFLSSLAAAVVLLLCVFLGVSRGRQLAQAKIISQNAQAITQGLKYFYQDQDRFPSAAEFSGNLNLMLNYFSVFPLPQVPTSQCPQNFVYQRPNSKAFLLNFCLPAAEGNFHSGWNQFSGEN